MTRLLQAALLPAILLCGCATVETVDVPVDHVKPDAGYRIAKLLGRDRRPANNPDALVFLAFSGGGTRAAALSYGVLEELRRTSIVVNGHRYSMLDEVDLVSGVCGGSFTALAYALYGEAVVEMSGDKAKAMKRESNTRWIYPPPPNRADAFKAADWARLVESLSADRGTGRRRGQRRRRARASPRRPAMDVPCPEHEPDPAVGFRVVPIPQQRAGSRAGDVSPRGGSRGR